MRRTRLEQELQIIREDLLLLGSMVETALIDSVTALIDHDLKKSGVIYANDEQINARRFDLEGQIIVTIATQSPVSFDLRFLASALNICTELERIGDYAKTIAQINLLSEGISVPRFLKMLYDMGIKTSDMLHRAMTAFIHVNGSSATRIISDDDAIDTMYNNLYSELMEFLIRGAHNAERVNHLLWVGHNLERAADRVTNICERTIYIETGELIDMSSSTLGFPK